MVALIGASDIVAGAALLLQPMWFFEKVGNFAPYEGDAGAFVLAIGVGLLSPRHVLRALASCLSSH